MTSQSWAVFGHDWAIDFLRRGMENDRLRHAYLITGPHSIGKRTLAHAFAMALNCTHDDSQQRPCGECRSCRLVLSGNHPDILYTETDANSGQLKIEAIRTISSRIAIKPYHGRYRIAILDDFDHAQPRAQDALLKTLEEPPPYAVLVLLAASLESVLPTIISRSQQIALRPVAADTVRDMLVERFGVDEEKATQLGRFCGGRLGWAIQAIEDPAVLDHRTEALDLLEEIIQSNRAVRFSSAEKLARNKGQLGDLLALWLTYWRDALLMMEGAAVKLCNVDRRPSLERMQYTVNAEQARRALGATQTLLDHLQYNVNLRLHLEAMLLDYPGLQHETTSL